jgi:glycosyltransferase involved in cell wall biosynthesis
MISRPRRFCLVPRLVGVGGMVSFQARVADGLKQFGYDVCFDLDDRPYDAVLVIGGTRHIGRLRRARQAGIPIIQRLDGRNWLHRLRKVPGFRPGSLRHFLRAEYGNWLLEVIRTRLADRIVYQSIFSQTWWEREAGITRVPSQVIYNAVNLQEFHPNGPFDRPQHVFRVLLVEGSLLGGYELGLIHALDLVHRLEKNHHLPVELMVVGRVSETLQGEVKQTAPVPVHFSGLVPRESIPQIDRSAHLLFSGDLNAACPNSVIEAMACGLPVLAYDTGALSELVGEHAGLVVPYGGDPWKLETPDVNGLAQAAEHILNNQEEFRRAARDRAEDLFASDQMVRAYLETLLEK